MTTYDGYTERMMLDVLAQRCAQVKLEAVEVPEDHSNYLARAWRLYCCSTEFGEFEAVSNSIFEVVYRAFKPHKQFADQQRQQMREMGKKLMNDVIALRGDDIDDSEEDATP